MEWNIIVWCGVYIYIISAIDNIFLRMRVYIYLYICTYTHPVYAWNGIPDGISDGAIKTWKYDKH